MHRVPDRLHIFVLVVKDPSIPLLPNTPHGHARKSILDGSDNGIFEGSWEPFSYGLGGLAPDRIIASELHLSLVPNCNYLVNDPSSPPLDDTDNTETTQ